MNHEQCEEYSSDLGLQINSLDLIQENKYCLIYLAQTHEGKRIIKKYRGHDPSLIRVEFQALSFYHELAMDNPDLTDSGDPMLNDQKNLLCIGFVDGEPLSDFLYKSRNNPDLQIRSAHYMRLLGKLNRSIYEKTQRPDQSTSPFIFEYFRHSSKRLEEIPALGSTLFRNYSRTAAEISEEFEKASIIPSFVHGDFVFRNIHVHEERVGLIDFANAIYLSHPLNDIYNMRMALGNMVLPKKFKIELALNFNEGFGSVVFPEIAHHFYFEYQRRRWLMLKLSWLLRRDTKLRWYNVKDFLQGLRGLMTFAKSYKSGIQSL